MIDKDFIAKSIDHYGTVVQIANAMEECAELIKALGKLLRDKPDMENIAEEIADVTIHIEIIKQCTGVTDVDINEWIDKKQKRLMKRINKDERHKGS